MGLLGFIKDVVLLPVDVALDVTGITPIIRVGQDMDLMRHNQDNDKSVFGTFDRLKSMVDNLDETRK